MPTEINPAGDTQSEKSLKELLLRRRTVLQLGVGLGIGTVLGRWGGNRLLSVLQGRALTPSPESPPPIPVATEGAENLAFLSPEHQRQVAELAAFRAQIGLSGLPILLEQRLAGYQTSSTPYQKEEWPTTTAAIQLEQIAPENQSYAVRAAEIVNQLLGDRAPIFVKKIATDPATGRGNTFHPGTRTYNLNADIRQQIPELELLVGMVLHECLGHGTDPHFSLGENVQLPLTVLIALEHGKWQALTQAFKVPGEFLRHPGDMMLNQVKFEMGKKLGQTLIAHKFEWAEVTRDRYFRFKLHHQLTALSSEKNQDKIIFTRRLCQELGDYVVEMMLAKPELFSSTAASIVEKYQVSLEQALVEIYAEMMRLALTPDQTYAPNNQVGLIHKNEAITQGITTVIKAIRGVPAKSLGITLPQLRQRLRHPSRAVQEQWELENQALKASEMAIEEVSEPVPAPSVVEAPPESVAPEPAVTEPATPATPATPAASAEVSELAAQIEEKQAEIFDFDTAVERFYHGELPKLLSDHPYSQADLDVFVSYAKLLAEVVKHFPELKQDPLNFDHPRMHVWDSTVLGNAANADNVRNAVYALINNQDIAQFVNPKSRHSLVNRQQVIADFLTGHGTFKSYSREQRLQTDIVNRFGG